MHICIYAIYATIVNGCFVNYNSNMQNKEPTWNMKVATCCVVVGAVAVAAVAIVVPKQIW